MKARAIRKSQVMSEEEKKAKKKLEEKMRAMKNETAARPIRHIGRNKQTRRLRKQGGKTENMYERGSILPRCGTQPIQNTRTKTAGADSR